MLLNLKNIVRQGSNLQDVLKKIYVVFHLFSVKLIYVFQFLLSLVEQEKATTVLASLMAFIVVSHVKNITKAGINRAGSLSPVLSLYSLILEKKYQI